MRKGQNLKVVNILEDPLWISSQGFMTRFYDLKNLRDPLVQYSNFGIQVISIQKSNDFFKVKPSVSVTNRC